jgi:hypothetical protein
MLWQRIETRISFLTIKYKAEGDTSLSNANTEYEQYIEEFYTYF